MVPVTCPVGEVIVKLASTEVTGPAAYVLTKGGPSWGPIRTVPDSV